MFKLYIIILNFTFISLYFSTSVAWLRTDNDLINSHIQIITLEKLLWREVRYVAAHSSSNEIRTTVFTSIFHYNNEFLTSHDTLQSHNWINERFIKFEDISEWKKFDHESAILSNSFDQFRKVILGKTFSSELLEEIMQMADEILLNFSVDYAERLFMFVGYDREKNVYEEIKKVSK